MTNNGAFHGNAWWKHPVPGTDKIVTEQIESRSHNEFYDVFKDGQYVGTYQMSADATHITQPSYQLFAEHRLGHSHNFRYVPSGYSPEIDDWRLSNVLVRPLPPEPTGATGDPADQNDEPTSLSEEERDLDIQLDLDDQDLQQDELERSKALKPTPDPESANQQDGTPLQINADLIADALKATSQPETKGGRGELAASSTSEQPTEPATSQRVLESLDELTGEKSEQVNSGSMSSRSPESKDIDATPPSSQEITEATEQVIATAQPAAPSPNAREALTKIGSQDPFRDEPLQISPAEEESLGSEEVLAEEPPPSVDEQNDDDLPLLG